MKSPDGTPPTMESEFVRTAIARMDAAPPFFTDSQWELLAAYEGPIVSGDPEGWTPKSKRNEVMKKDCNLA